MVIAHVSQSRTTSQASRIQDSRVKLRVQLDTIEEILPANASTTHEDQFREVARITEFLLQHTTRDILDGVLPGLLGSYSHGTSTSMLQAVLTLFFTDVDPRTGKKLDFSHGELLSPLIRCLVSALPPTDPMVGLWDNGDHRNDNTAACNPANTMTQVLDSQPNGKRELSPEQIVQDARACYDERVFTEFMKYNPFSMTTRPFRTSTGFIGCASSITKSGDGVCVFGSCSMPVILRMVQDKYEFVSVAHVVGALYGEVWKDLKGEKIEIQEFCLR